jgi:hypothetical protein
VGGGICWLVRLVGGIGEFEGIKSLEREQSCV